MAAQAARDGRVLEKKEAEVSAVAASFSGTECSPWE